MITKIADEPFNASIVEEIIGYWKELGRRRFYAQPGADPEEFERL